jgi:CRP/FNR family cyclic AMP-dependent transcriptional regulator
MKGGRMRARFEGEEGTRRLLDVVLNATIVEHNAEVAKRLVELGEIVDFQAGADIIRQDADDNDAYLIVTGEADVFVKSRPVGTRKVGDTVGEMSIVDPSEARSATVRARTDVVCLKVSEKNFLQLLDEHPRVWRILTRVSMERLRQRSQFIDLPNDTPLLFIGCSVESLGVAEALQLGLQHSGIVAQIWTNGVFTAGDATIEDLMRAVNESDFAAFVFHPDDKVESRGREYNAPRDNVIFELGLFMGRLDRKRTFIIKEQHSDVKIPTDLLGLTGMTYIHRAGGSLQVELAPVCTQIRDIATKLGVK